MDLLHTSVLFEKMENYLQVILCGGGLRSGYWIMCQKMEF